MPTGSPLSEAGGVDAVGRQEDVAGAGRGRRAVVIGAGIVGTATAARLQGAGFQVTLVDKGGVGAGCSAGNLGGIAVTEVVPQARVATFLKVPRWLLDPKGPLTIRMGDILKVAPWLARFLASGTPGRVEKTAAALSLLLTRSARDFSSLMAEADAADLIGSLDCLALYDTSHEIAADKWSFELRARHGVPCTAVSGSELRELEPELAHDFAGGWVFDGWHHVWDPLAAVEALAKLATQRGAEIRVGDVTGFARRDDGTVSAVSLRGDNAIPTDLVIVTAGAWSHELATALGDTLPLIAERGYHTMFPNPGVAPKRQIIYGPQGFGITPLNQGLRVGGSVEIADIDTPPDPRRAAILVEKAKRVFPRFDASNPEPKIWMGARPATPDSRPVIGASPSARNVIYACGHGHLGLTMSGTTADLVTGLAVGRAPNIDLAPFGIERFV